MTSPSPTPPPAVDQVREAAVEAVARWLCDTYEPALDWDDILEHDRGAYLREARQVLSLPAVSELLAEARADGERSRRQTHADRLLIQKNNHAAAEVAGRYFADDEEEWGQLYTDVLDALTGDLSIAAAIRQTEGNNR